MAASVVPSIDQYAEAITGPLNQLPAQERPLLRLETGRHLVDNAGWLLTTIVAVKGRGHQHVTPPAGVAAKVGWTAPAGAARRSRRAGTDSTSAPPS